MDIAFNVFHSIKLIVHFIAVISINITIASKTSLNTWKNVYPLAFPYSK